MKALEDYIAFDLEFNQYEGAYQIIQVSAVRFTNGKKSITTTPTFTPISP